MGIWATSGSARTWKAGLAAAVLAALIPVSALAKGGIELTLTPEIFVSGLDSVDTTNHGGLELRTGFNYGGTLGLRMPVSKVFGLELNAGMERVTTPRGAASTQQRIDRTDFTLLKGTAGLRIQLSKRISLFAAARLREVPIIRAEDLITLTMDTVYVPGPLAELRLELIRGRRGTSLVLDAGYGQLLNVPQHNYILHHGASYHGRLYLAGRKSGFRIGAFFDLFAQSTSISRQMYAMGGAFFTLSIGAIDVISLDEPPAAFPR